MRLFEKTWQLQIYPFKFFKADGLFSWIALTVGQFSKFEQLAQLVTPFFIAHWRIPQILSQNTVLSPSTRQPWQLMCSGRIGALFNSAHSFAVFFHNFWSSLIVAIYASHFSQSSPQYAIIFFIIVMYLHNFKFIALYINWNCLFDDKSIKCIGNPYNPRISP